jgi:hypothetical protein
MNKSGCILGLTLYLKSRITNDNTFVFYQSRQLSDLVLITMASRLKSGRFPCSGLFIEDLWQSALHKQDSGAKGPPDRRKNR